MPRARLLVRGFPRPGRKTSSPPLPAPRPPTSGWGEEGLVTGNLVLTLGKDSPGNPTCGTPDPLFLCCDSWTGHQSGYFPRPRSLEAVRVATPRWPGSHPTSIFSLIPIGVLSQCPHALWAEPLCPHLPQALPGSGPAPWGPKAVLPCSQLPGIFLTVS